MTKLEARRLALIIVANELDISLDNSDEWWEHPEGTGERFNKATSEQIRAEGAQIRDSLFAKAERLAKAAAHPYARPVRPGRAKR